MSSPVSSPRRAPRLVARFVATLSVAVLFGANAPARAQQAPFSGDWLSDGYGYFAHVDDAQLTMYEVTPVGASGKFRATRAPAGDAVEHFLLPGGAYDVTLAKRGEDGFALQLPGTASTISFRRVATAPDGVGRELPSDPETTFEVFWQTFAIHYPFFALREVDWAATRAKYRPQVTKATTPAELFAILQAMIEPLHDAHTSLRAQDLNRQFGGAKPVARELDAAGRRRALAVVDEHYVSGRLESGCNGHVRFGELDAKTAYLRIDGFGNYALKPGFAATREALETTLDVVMRSCAGKEALVIDVRLNGGGSDLLGVAVASRLTDRDYVGFVKRARNDPDHAPEGERGWTAPQPTHVVPSQRPHYLGRVFLLTGPDSVSAAETFTMALLGRTPHVVRVGENTQGVYSDVLGRKLPNGWSFGLPNEVFLDEHGVHYERRGVPPDHVVALFEPSDLDAGKDLALEKVFELIDDG